MELYFRRQLAARVNDFVKGCAGADVVVTMKPYEFESLLSALKRNIGEEPYLAFDAILAQYALCVNYESHTCSMLFHPVKSGSPEKEQYRVTMPLDLLLSTLDAALYHKVEAYLLTADVVIQKTAEQAAV